MTEEDKLKRVVGDIYRYVHICCDESFKAEAEGNTAEKDRWWDYVIGLGMALDVCQQTVLGIPGPKPSDNSLAHCMQVIEWAKDYVEEDCQTPVN